MEGTLDKAKDAYGGLANDKSKQAESKVDKMKGSFKDKAGDEKNKNNQ
ncbi:CsbD family protein [Virgibacillus oceani]